jgi:hypothetical protein
VTPEQAKEISAQIRGAKEQHERVLNRALERALPGIDPREIDRITHVVIDIHKDIIAALKRLKDLLN